MFGCCNALYSSSCRCNRCNGKNGCCGNATLLPVPVFPPLLTPAPNSPAVLRGLEATLTAGSGGTVANGFPIPFNNLVSNNVLAASFVTGAITLMRPGTYLVNWWVATEIDGTDAEKEGQSEATESVGSQVSFSAALNGNIVSGSYAPYGTGQVSGSTFVTVQNAPATLQIVNSSGENVLLAETTAQAGVTVTQLA